MVAGSRAGSGQLRVGLGSVWGWFQAGLGWVAGGGLGGFRVG